MPEVILFEPDPETRLMLRSLLERDGVTVNEVEAPEHLKDVTRASKAQALLATAATRQASERLFEEVTRARPDMDVLTPLTYTAALLDGAAQREQLAEFARDSILLLAVVAEDAAKRTPVAEKLARLAELTALRMGLSRMTCEIVATVASLAAVGPSLAAFRFGAPPDGSGGAATPVSATSPAHGGSADGGIGRDLQASIAAAAALRGPWDLKGALEALEERFDGRGRPRGLEGKKIPIAARIVAVAREYAQVLGGGAEEMVATELVRSRAGAEFDPKVVDAFFRALRDESYLDRFTSGKKGPKVLVVDGDAAALAVAELRLGSAGFSVAVCDDGAKAAELIAADPPDAIIADTVLPRLDGISLLLKLKRDPKCAQVPLFFTSTRTDAALLNKALKLGAKDVLAKPINFDVLVAKLRTQQQGAPAAAAASKNEGVQGDLSEMPLTDFFQVLSLGRKTVKITVNSSSGTGMIYFERGSPIAAATRDTRGFDAFATIVTWSQGTFSLTFGEVAPERNLDRGLENMIVQLSGASRANPSASSAGAGGSQHDGDMGPGVFQPPPGAAPAEDDPYAAPRPKGKDIEFDLG